jgi:outer membrane receptor protein involved in Fe transport
MIGTSRTATGLAILLSACSGFAQTSVAWAQTAKLDQSKTPPASNSKREPETLQRVVVNTSSAHSSTSIRDRVDTAFDASRAEGSTQDIHKAVNPISVEDGLRYAVSGVLLGPGGGSRFGTSNVRTFGNWTASSSIDGLPSFNPVGEEGGGYTSSLIPGIAVKRIGVLKGGRGVSRGDGSDGGVIDTEIKSGRDYSKHAAISIDVSSVPEYLGQLEAADHTDQWDYYVAGSGLFGNFAGKPSNLDDQWIGKGLGKFGYNPNVDTRIELIATGGTNDVDVYRSGKLQDVETRSLFGGLTLDHKFDETYAMRVGAMVNDGQTEWAARGRDRQITTTVGFADVSANWNLSNNAVYLAKVGAEARRTDYRRDRIWDATFDDFALYNKNTVRLNDRLDLSAGVRLTNFNNDINLNGVRQPDTLKDKYVLAYEASASYKLFEDTRLRMSYATGFNRFFSKYGNFGTDALNAKGAGDNVVESRTIEAGIRQDWSWGHFDAGLYNIIQDGVPRRNNNAIENMKVDQSGLELELSLKPLDALSVSAVYTRVLQLEATRANGQKVNGNIFWDGQTSSTPKDQLAITTIYDFSEAVSLWSLALISTGFEAVDAKDKVTDYDGFVRWDAGANWQLTDALTVRGRVENILDEKDFGATVAGRPDPNDGIGRTFWVGVDIVF